MKKTMWKTTFREIRQSLGRFLAIMAIVALGVGLFAGLKVTKPFMVKTAEDYFAENNFYDLKLLSTLGFEAEDVDYFAAQPDVRAAEGAYSFDILCKLGTSESGNVMKAHSLPEHINRITVLHGRLPENTKECVVDSRLLGKDAIGQTIRLAAENDEDDLENFKETEFTVTGIVESSYYIQFERGNTSLGTGTVSGYFYLLPEAFDSEAFTEIFVKFDKDFPLYGEEYDTFMEQKEPEWEQYLETAARRRYEDILAEANEELADAKAEFETEKADAEAELADAKKELDDAAVEIADGKKEIADAKQEIADAYKEIADGEAELADGEAELAEGEQELADAEAEFLSGMSEYHTNKAQVNDGLSTLKAMEPQILQQEAMLLQQETELKAAYAAGYITEEMYQQGMSQITAGKEGIASYKANLEELKYAERVLSSTLTILLEAHTKIQEGKEELADARIELEDGRRELADAKKELADAEKELADAEIELADGEAEYLDGLQEYEDGLKEFNEEIAEAEAEIADAEAEIADIEAPDTYVLDRETNVGYVCLESDSNIVADVAVVFPVFFFLVAALVCMTTMNRMIEEQRTQIGVLKALGYSNTTIMCKYLFYSGTAAFVGCVSGFALGTYLLTKVIWAAYQIMYDMGAICYFIDWPIAIISLIVSLLCSMGVTWYSCRRELNEVAASLMRPKAPKAGKRVFLEYIPFLWKHLKFLQKVSIRNVLRYKKRFFMMIVGISGCTALLVTGFGIQDSIADVVNIQYEEILLYDMSVTFKDVPNQSELMECESVMEGRIKQYDRMLETSVDIQYEGGTKSVSMIVPEKTERLADYVDLHTMTGEPISFPGVNEVVITHNLATALGLEINDTIELVDEDHNVLTASVSGICQNFVFNYVFMHPDTYSRQWKEPEFKTAYVNIAESADVHLLSADLMKLDQVMNVTVSKDVEDRFNNMLGSLDFIVLVIILCAAALAFIVLYNLTNINITERIREIATIKVLGFYKKETATYVFRENLMLTAIGAVVGLFLGKIFHAFVMSCIKIDMVAFDVRINPPSYVYSILFTFGFAWLVNKFMSGKIDKISMTESLKSVD